ncbi:MAG TPA: monofunctional biosynthetic peptidoglycan transglycosylase [Thermoanaerobaculia bacterium]
MADGASPARSGFFRRVGIAAGALLLAAVVLFFATLPDVHPLARSFPKTTAFMDLRREALARAGQNPRLEWIPVPISRISPWLRRAVVAAEDARFYQHGGVDWDAVRGAAGKDWQRGALRVGASTITQQLAKNLYLSPSRTLWRKLREFAITRELESTLSKERILELYLNVVEFGPRTYGAEAAARRYFGKTAESLSAHESATLAAVIPSPRIYDPVRHPQRVERRAQRILRQMQITEERGAPGVPQPSAAPPIPEPSPPADSADSRL